MVNVISLGKCTRKMFSVSLVAVVQVCSRAPSYDHISPRSWAPHHHHQPATHLTLHIPASPTPSPPSPLSPPRPAQPSPAQPGAASVVIRNLVSCSNQFSEALCGSHSHTPAPGLSED